MDMDMDMEQSPDMQYSALAFYINNALFTWLPAKADFDLSSDPLAPERPEDVEDILGLHIHEYVHQLHNTSTVAGLQLLMNRLVALQLFVSGTNSDGHYIRKGKVIQSIDGFSLAEFEKEYSWNLGALDKCKREGYLSDFKCTFFEVAERATEQSNPCNIFGAEASFKLGGESYIFELTNLGYNIITEGIAYEIEKHIRCAISGNEGVLLEHRTPPVPYRIYRPIVESLVGRKCSLAELVKVGTMALQSRIPSLGLKAAAVALKDGDERFEGFIAESLVVQEEVFAQYRGTVDMLMETVFSGTTVKEGLRVLDSVVMRALEKRRQNQFYELLFVEEKLSVAAFFELIQEQGLPPRCILQDKGDEEAVLYWMGDNVAELSDASVGAISTLQCALQFSQLHISAAGSFNNTKDLSSRPGDLSCPYLKVCPLKAQRVDPTLCATAPWMHDIGLTEGEVCWYVNGVKSLRNPRCSDYDEIFS